MADLTDDDISEAMILYGGSFASGLGSLFRQADEINQARLKAAFPDFWARYAELIQLRRAQAKAGKT